MGNTGSWWTWTGRTFYGNKERLSFPSHTEEHGTFTRTKPYSTLLFKTARELQEVRSSDFGRNKLNPV